jgi:type II secretory pathway pseudopilin PulG
MKLSQPLRSSKGVTIIESVVALGILAIILTAIMAMVVTAINSSTLSKSRTEATNYANEGAEAARSIRDSTTWGDFWIKYVNNGVGSLCTTCEVTSTGGLAVLGRSIVPYTRKVVFSDASTGGVQNRALVDVTVTWNNRGQTEKVELTTYLTNWHK